MGEADGRPDHPPAEAAGTCPADAVTGRSSSTHPPGTSCPVVETMRGADFVLLVTEPTPFGLHDLRLAVEVARDELGLPVGVVINRDGVGDAGVDDYCAAEGIPILMRIPLDRRIAEAYSEGCPWCRRCRSMAPDSESCTRRSRGGGTAREAGR